ncbi:MAG: 16S rRNA (adenine(1518)-N(6)/adenine(1519)-N(6))-dimethyltransferase RsmA [bacterium]|nr:16S rRNA (adenine(1518)-N(6)/adenine(1519)-N(6))-dimethyltransferase RsmA [bacterium]
MSNIENLLKSHNLTPNKLLGQSFLKDENIVYKFIKSVNIDKEDIILEIGPGAGVFTKLLCEKAKKVVAVEKDKILFDFLVKDFENIKNVVFFNKDILCLELKDLVNHYGKFKLVSNVPFSITSDFLYWFLSNRGYIERSVIILQKEVVDKINAKVGSKLYGAISVFFQYYMEIAPLFKISGGAFFPTTKIVAEVVAITPKTFPDIGRNAGVSVLNEKKFFEVVKKVFFNRRKQLKNSLALKIDKLGSIDLSRRPETLNCKEFVELVFNLEERDGNK